MGQDAKRLSYRYFKELLQNRTPVVPMLSTVNYKKNGQQTTELAIAYFDPHQHKIRKIYNTSFAQYVLQHLNNYDKGSETGILAGIVRQSLPDVVEQWNGDTIEKTDRTAYSVYRGILKILNKRDGLPVVVSSNTQVVGDVVPGIKKILQSKNHLAIQTELKKLNGLQKRIERIIGRKPLITQQPAEQKSKQTKSTLDFSIEGMSERQTRRRLMVSKL